jgi:maleylacetoacetate isomerase
MSDVVLYDYWRSSASYRLRIALNLAKISYRAISVDMVFVFDYCMLIV